MQLRLPLFAWFLPLSLKQRGDNLEESENICSSIWKAAGVQGSSPGVHKPSLWPQDSGSICSSHVTSGKRLHLCGLSHLGDGIRLQSCSSCSPTDRFRATLRLPGHHSLAGAALSDPGAHSLMLQGPPTSGLGLGKNYSLAVTGMMVTHISDPSPCGPLPCQPQKVMGSKRKAFFCELGQPDSEVMVTQGPWRKSQELLGSLRGELISILGSHHSGQSQSERAVIHREHTTSPATYWEQGSHHWLCPDARILQLLKRQAQRQRQQAMFATGMRRDHKTAPIPGPTDERGKESSWLDC